MNYTMTTPCNECPFLKRMAHGFTLRRLKEFASGERHATWMEETSEFRARSDETPHCAGALIFLERQERSAPDDAYRGTPRTLRSH